MVDIPMRSSQPLNQNSVLNINVSSQNVISSQNISSLNEPKQSAKPQAYPSTVSQATGNQPVANNGINQISTAIQTITVPTLHKQIQKGQKVPLDATNQIKHIKVCLGWNVINPQCDIDVSAFILGLDGKVLGDDWFVFYGQPDSPDRSTHFSMADNTDREFISIDLNTLNPHANKIVFVLTINDAITHNLNFSMVKDAYIRILNADNQQELVSFQMTDYYSNVISMMIGEIYLHNGIWKCNAIGNGVAKDLEGLCKLYGVQVV